MVGRDVPDLRVTVGLGLEYARLCAPVRFRRARVARPERPSGCEGNARRVASRYSESVRTAALLIDDDARLAEMVSEYLGRHGTDVKVVPDGKRGIAALRGEPFDIVLLDVMLPEWDGFEICRHIRATPEIAGLPIIMLTARADETDRIVGLEIGADDYLPKPFNPRELLARIRAVLRRATQTPQQRSPFHSGGLEVDFEAREVTVDGRRVVLTHYEFEVLSILARAAGRVLSREQFLDAMKGRAYEVFDRSIDVHISNLRGKLERDPKAPRYIKTVRGSGYILLRHAE